MRLYYIPTSSLNFNNIFSTESISPAAFYALRGFGYSRWTMIPENNVENAILLYDSPRNFTRPISDLEDHPMLIEFRSDEEFPQYADGVFYSDHTIYLNPWNTRVWFFSEKNKITARSLSDSSLETKMLRLYMSKVLVGNFDGIYNPPTASQSIELKSAAIEDDRKINRLKGLLYGYYIGAAKSITPGHAELIHTLYVIQDAFAAIAASPDKKATHSQEEVLKSALNLLREQSDFFHDLLETAGSREKALELINLFERHNINTPLRDYDLRYHLHNLRYDQSQEGSSIKWIQRALDKVCKTTEVSLLSPDDPEIIIDSNGLSTIKCSDEELQVELLKQWVGGLFMNPKYNGKISSQNDDLATDLTLAAREHIGDKWDDSPVRTYLNKLRHLINGEEEQLEWNNGILSSVAAVVFKGDDWDKLLRFMQYQNMNDYKIAFAVYGQLNGFANLTRDFTDILLNQDSQYVASVYRDFCGQLFDQRIFEEPMPKPAIILPKQKTEKPVPISKHVKSDDSLSEMVRRIANYLRDAGAKEKKNSSLEKILNAALKEYSGPTNDTDFLAFLATYASTRKSREPWKSLYPLLKTEPNEPTLELQFDIQDAHLQFYNDPSARAFIRRFIGLDDERVIKQVEDDVKWFQEHYQGNEIYAKRPKDNKSVLEHFHNYLIGKKVPTEKTHWLAEIYKKVDVDKLIKCLREIYK